MRDCPALAAFMGTPARDNFFMRLAFLEHQLSHNVGRDVIIVTALGALEAKVFLTMLPFDTAPHARFTYPMLTSGQ